MPPAHQSAVAAHFDTPQRPLMRSLAIASKRGGPNRLPQESSRYRPRYSLRFGLARRRSIPKDLPAFHSWLDAFA